MLICWGNVFQLFLGHPQNMTWKWNTLNIIQLQTYIAPKRTSMNLSLSLWIKRKHTLVIIDSASVWNDRSIIEHLIIRPLNWADDPPLNCSLLSCSQAAYHPSHQSTPYPRPTAAATRTPCNLKIAKSHGKFGSSVRGLRAECDRHALANSVRVAHISPTTNQPVPCL